MHPDQTAPTGAVWSGSTMFVYEASSMLVDDKNIHFVIMRFLKRLIHVSSVLGFSWNRDHVTIGVVVFIVHVVSLLVSDR